MTTRAEQNREYYQFRKERCFRVALELSRTLTITDIWMVISALRSIIAGREVKRGKHGCRLASPKPIEPVTRLSPRTASLTDLTTEKYSHV